MSKRDTRLNRKIEKLIKEDRENTDLIKNLEHRNNYLAEKVITLTENEEYRKFRIEQLELLLETKGHKIKTQQERMNQMKATWKMQTKLLAAAYILFVVLMCIAIS